ncbi:carbonic anhydrase-related protein-like isoform X1 [Pecten maximus]|uniref:carbonic anhydrase-related protein-like isoform X1 n=2 Tax=Pecten maximus TaxID=6579 RepID=UPI001457EA68|nr:carbonic anhydrase-related protein-like isoform X1 [Pecten maximus]
MALNIVYRPQYSISTTIGSQPSRKKVRFRQIVPQGAPRPALKHLTRPPHSHSRLSFPFTAHMICMVRTVRLRDGGNGFIYDRAMEWGKDFPSANGTRQSPIDFMSSGTQYDAALAKSPLAINYCTSRETDILNNGQNVVVYPKSKGAETSVRFDMAQRSTISGGPLSLGHEFELSEIRFHWGSSNSRGSEHRVNGKAFPMEVQFIHWNASLYSSMEDACGKPDGTAAVCLFVQIGRENATVKSLISDALCDVIFKGRQKTTNTPFNPVCLLPDPDLRDYWSYEGSLTFPPCHENTTWIMLRYPLLVSPGQIEEFRRLLCYCKGDSPGKGSSGRLVDNFRPVQPLNGRVVRASFQ